MDMSRYTVEELAELAVLLEHRKQLSAWDWELCARPAQRLPQGYDWIFWLILAGRGYGKTRTGAETVRHWVREYPYVNLIGATADDARDIMIEGESGILAVCPDSERPLYKKSERKLIWPNGAVSLIFTADEPERLRGKQHGKLWCDELAAWRYPEAWDQASLGLRLGIHPQAVITTTPRPTKLIRLLAKDPRTHITRGTTYENKDNLAEAFIQQIITKYEGTRLGRQELNAEILEDNPGALWQRSQIDETRIGHSPELLRVVVAVDPAVSSNEDSDLTGIVCCGRDGQKPPHFYVLDDVSDIYSPDKWGQAVVNLYRKRDADRVVAEVNQGGDMVEAILRSKHSDIPYSAVRATRGKAVRAEPIAALYEQGRVHHVGSFPQLEDQMCDWNPVSDDKSPDRMDALVWGMTELSEGSDLAAYYHERAAAAEAKKNPPRAPEAPKAREWSEALRTVRMGILPPGELPVDEVNDWIALCEEQGQHDAVEVARGVLEQAKRR